MTSVNPITLLQTQPSSEVPGLGLHPMGLTGPFIHGEGAGGILGLCRPSLAGGRGQAMVLVSKMDGEL